MDDTSNIIREVNFEDDSVVDSRGDMSSISHYLNKVTPLRNESAKFYEQFASSIDFSDDIVDSNLCSTSAQLNQILYTVELAEADSTSEGSEAHIRNKPRTAPDAPESVFEPSVQSLNQTIHEPNERSSNQSIVESNVRSSDQSIDEPNEQSLNQTIAQPNEGSSDKSIDELNEQSLNQTIAQPNVGSSNRYKKRFECPIVACSDRFAIEKSISRHIKQKHGKKNLTVPIYYYVMNA